MQKGMSALPPKRRHWLRVYESTHEVNCRLPCSGLLANRSLFGLRPGTGETPSPLTPYPSTRARPGTFSETRLYRPERETGSAAWGINMWTRRGHPSTTADMVLSWGEILYRASVMLAGLIIVFGAINCLYQVSILEEPIIPVVPFVLAAAIWLVGHFCRQMSA